MSAKNNKPRALVIGGSLGGLCAGVCLRAAGWCVSIFERSTGLMDDRGAGIVLQFEVLNREADELPALLTDRTGRKRRTSVPPGMVCPEHWQKQMDIARAFLPPQLRELLEATQEPFAQPIRDLAVPQMVFDRTVLVGEAAFVLRPHTAAAAAKAAADGMVLGEALRDGDENFTENLQRFEAPQMEMGLNLRNYGIRAGNQSQFPSDP